MYETTDMNLATCLMTLGHGKPEMDENKNPMKVVFRFAQDAHLEEDVRKYYDGHLLVDPRLFATNFWKVKTEAYGLMKNKKAEAA